MDGIEEISNSLVTNIIPILVTGIAGLVGVILIQMASRRISDRVDKTETLDTERQQQILTVVDVARWVLTIVVIVIITLMIMGKFVDVTPMLTGLGVAGLAVSLGGQTLVKDFIGGIFILLENQFSVGDVIKVGDVSGAVERLTLRATYVRNLDGLLHIIPNGEIRIVSNVTKGWSRAKVQIGVAYEEDIDRVVETLTRVAEGVAKDPEFAPFVIDTPIILGPGLGDWAITYTILIKTIPGKHWPIERELRKQVHLTFQRKNIVSPYPRQEVFFVPEPPEGGGEEKVEAEA